MAVLCENTEKSAEDSKGKNRTAKMMRFTGDAVQARKLFGPLLTPNVRDKKWIFKKNLYSIISNILFENQEGIILDVYYNDHGHPKYLHDLIGESKAVELLTESLLGEIRQRKNPDKI